MKKLFLLLCLGGMLSSLQAQDTLSIQQIQNVSANDLAACIDTSFYLGDTVYTYGVVVQDGGLAQATGGRNLWLQNGTGPFSGIDLYTINVPTPVAGTDVLDLLEGDSVVVRGIIDRFGNETEILPLEITVVDAGKQIQTQTISVGDLNDNLQDNLPATGEQWEGSYVTLTDLTVTAVSFFSGGNRVSFICADAQGNLINISDRFLVQRLPANGGTFVPPNTGDQFDTIRGVVAHSANGCFGANGRGYELYPHKAEDYVAAQGASSPLISNISRNPVTPTAMQDVSVSATIEDNDGTVATATLHYAVGVSNTNFLTVPMTGSGSTYTGTIPNTAFSDGDFVKYYITAEDNDNLTSTSPDINNNFNPLFFAVRDNGTTIFDLQFTPYENGNSGYTGLEVTVEGIVTATADANDLGFVYMQQETGNAWTGISLVQNAQLASLSRGDKISVRGTVEENFGFTRLSDIVTVTTLSTGNPLPAATDADPALFSDYDFATTEPYEGMLVRLVAPNNADIYVVDENADDPSNFAEYRVGSDQFDPMSGCRVLAGRVTGNAFGSLAFSYVNDTSWATNSGVMTVPACQVIVGDTMASLTGIMYYSFGQMKLLPRNNEDAASFSGANCVDGINSIEDELVGTTLKVFPNPTAAALNVQYDFPKVVKAEAIMTDLMGRRVGQQDIFDQNGTIQFQTEQLSAGTYLLNLQVEGVVIARQKVMLIK
ncbi:MAG: T9SS type A sorting domain-containing protein [Bacteroidota bacterium]